jgi:hypothetical protein
MTRNTTTHRTHALLQNLAAISGDFHTHREYWAFYETFGSNIDGFIGNYELCIQMARALTDWEIQNGGPAVAYDDVMPWIEVVEQFVDRMILRSIETGEIQNEIFTLNQVLQGDPA